MSTCRKKPATLPVTRNVLCSVDLVLEHQSQSMSGRVHGYRPHAVQSRVGLLIGGFLVRKSQHTKRREDNATGFSLYEKGERLSVSMHRE